MYKPFYFNSGDITIDIDNRNSGKTTKLFDDVIKHLKESDKKIAFLTEASTQFVDIRIKLEHILKNENVECGNRIIRITNMHGVDEDVRIYVDDFIKIHNIDKFMYLRRNIFLTCDIEDIKYFNQNCLFLEEVLNILRWKRKRNINKLLKGEK